MVNSILKVRGPTLRASSSELAVCIFGHRFWHRPRTGRCTNMPGIDEHLGVTDRGTNNPLWPVSAGLGSVYISPSLSCVCVFWYAARLADIRRNQRSTWRRLVDL